jgi:hypothetical protein
VRRRLVADLARGADQEIVAASARDTVGGALLHPRHRGRLRPPQHPPQRPSRHRAQTGPVRQATRSDRLCLPHSAARKGRHPRRRTPAAPGTSSAIGPWPPRTAARRRPAAAVGRYGAMRSPRVGRSPCWAAPHSTRQPR